MIDRVSTSYFRLPLEALGDAGHGAIDTEELIAVDLAADGLVGHGYAYTIGRGGRAIRALIEHDLAPLLVGQDTCDVEAHWDRMWRALLYVGRGGLAAFAIAALDIALWDLRGQREDKPLWALAGGAARTIPAYGSGVDLPKTLDAVLEQVEGFLNIGFRGVKTKVGKPDPVEDEKRVQAVRRLIGDDIDLMLDANMSWSVDEALRRGRRLEAFNPFWLEEPTAPEDVEGHAHLAQELTAPIAVGESLHSVQEFKRYIKCRAAGIVQIDPITNGGITPTLRVIGMADGAGLPVSSHYTDELSAHLLCAAANPIYLEKHAFSLDRYLEEPQEVVDGMVRPTDHPGNGMRFDRSALAPYAA